MGLGSERLLLAANYADIFFIHAGSFQDFFPANRTYPQV
jgi:hypothetical protein